MKLTKVLQFFVVAVFFLFQNANLKALDNSGSEFILAFLPNYNGNTGRVQLHLTSSVATNVTVEYPVNSPTFTQTVAVAPRCRHNC